LQKALTPRRQVAHQLRHAYAQALGVYQVEVGAQAGLYQAPVVQAQVAGVAVSHHFHHLRQRQSRFGAA